MTGELRRPITTAITAGVLLVGLTACGGSDDGGGGGDASAASETSAESAETTEESPSSSSTSEGEGGSVAPGEKPVRGVPQNVEGWEVTTLDEQGVNQLRDKDGCRYTTSQNHLGEGFPDDDEEASGMLADTLIDGLSKQMEMGEVQRSTDTVPTGLGNSGPTEMVRLDYDYTVDGDDTEYRSTVLARVFTEQEGSLYVMHSCPADAYDESELDSLKEKTSIQYVEPSSF